MLVGAIGLATLVLLLLLSEHGSGWLWRGGRGPGLYYCAACDLRYPRHELADKVGNVCPRGHYTEPPHDFPLGVVAIVACSVFIVAGCLLLVSGVVQVP